VVALYGCREGEGLCTAQGGVAGVGVAVAGHRSLYSVSHSVSGKYQTWEYGAAARLGKKNKVLMQKCCSWVENLKVEGSREGSLAAAEPVVASGVPCCAAGGVAVCGGARFALQDIKQTQLI